MTARVFQSVTLIAVVLGALLCAPAVCRAQIALDKVPDAAQGIDVEDRVGEFIPLDLRFKDERGNPIALGKFFKQGKPIVLTLNYSNCPGLCVAQLENLTATLRELNGAGIGEKFEIVTVSIDPNERPVRAAETKAKYVGLLRSEGAEKGWHFLTGDQASISSLAKSVGFMYSYDKQSKRYSHPAVTYFISSDGRICRYFISLAEEPQQFKFAINDAAEGKLTTSVSDMMVQMCYSYDPSANRYTADAQRLLSFGAGAFAIVLFGFTAPFWFAKRAANQPQTSTAAETATDGGYIEPTNQGALAAIDDTQHLSERT
ncbi:MAG: SCO family protein [Pirellulales bacterium]